MLLFGLPNELLVSIALCLESESDINSFCRTSKTLHTLLNPVLYSFIIQKSPEQVLFWAAKSEDNSHSTVQILIHRAKETNKDIDLDPIDDSYHTPLAYAAGNGNKELAILLAENGANVHHRIRRMGSLLHKGIKHKGIIEFLLQKCVCPNIQGLEGKPPLSLAAEAGNEVVVKMLLEHRADPNSKDDNGRTPLSYAYGQEVARLLLDYGADLNLKDRYNQTPLSLIVAQEPREWYGRVFDDDICHKKEAVVGLLLQRGADPESEGRWGESPLLTAAIAGCCPNGHIEVMKQLIEKGASVEHQDNMGLTPLWYAVTKRTEALVKLLLENGADPDFKGTVGRTVLSRAAAMGNKRIVELLLERGANPESVDDLGRTPLSWASVDRSQGHVEVMGQLIEKGASVEHKDKMGQAPLWHAVVTGGDEAKVKLLLDNGADPNSKAKYSRSPLSYAAQKICLPNYKEIVKLLIQHGGNPHSTDSSGRTPLWFATKYARLSQEELKLFKGGFQE